MYLKSEAASEVTSYSAYFKLINYLKEGNPLNIQVMFDHIRTFNTIPHHRLPWFRQIFPAHQTPWRSLGIFPQECLCDQCQTKELSYCPKRGPTQGMMEAPTQHAHKAHTQGYLHGINAQQCWQTSELLRFGFKLVERKLFCGRDLLFCVCISHGMSDLASKSKFSILFW